MVELLATFMEQREPSSAALNAPPGATVSRERPGAQIYLPLYRAIGAPVQWDARERMPRGELADLLAADSTHVYILRVAGEAMGLCEFLDVGSDEVELANFGLVPPAYGKGYGSYLLNHALLDCWRHCPRLWLRTDTNDHPNAVGTYERAGFRTWKQEWVTFPD